ncbi:MAG TPA: hypothetical protein GXZ48_06820 [Acholeplasmataceae bacterium]|nr:hypothetical protein [Acholeplasmataceae bacterium]
MITIDKHLNRLNKEIKSFARDLKVLEQNEGNYYSEKLTEKYLNIDGFYQSISNKVNDVLKKYFSHMKIATANISMNRSNEELDNIYRNLNTYMQDFKSLNEAAEYIFFNSSQQILKTIDSLIKAIPNNDFTFNYFLKTDDIITLELKEWIDLYNKIRFVIKKVDNIMDNNEFKENYSLFETCYLILMMNMEASKDQIKNYRI